MVIKVNISGINQIMCFWLRTNQNLAAFEISR